MFDSVLSLAIKLLLHFVFAFTLRVLPFTHVYLMLSRLSLPRTRAYFLKVKSGHSRRNTQYLRWLTFCEIMRIIGRKSINLSHWKVKIILKRSKKANLWCIKKCCSLKAPWLEARFVICNVSGPELHHAYPALSHKKNQGPLFSHCRAWKLQAPADQRRRHRRHQAANQEYNLSTINLYNLQFRAVTILF